MIKDEIISELFSLQDTEYRDFQSRLIPTVESGRVIGVRTPALRKYAKELASREDVTAFLRDLPHSYFDEDQLHAFVISGIKDYQRCIGETELFLPYVDNWATCDQMSPKIFRKNRASLLEHIKKWIRSEKTYTIRFAVGMLMQHFLDDEFSPEYPEMVSSLRSDEYYVNMMIAWYFATALAKQYEAVLPYIEQKRLDAWTHNRTIQKAVESYRISPERKAYLKSLKVPLK